MPSGLSSLPDNFDKGLHKGKYKKCNCFLKYVKAKNDSLTFKCLNCDK